MSNTIQETSTVGTSCSENVDIKLSFLPEKLRERLLPFQKKGILFALQRNGRCMIADEMGLGKTIQAIAISYYYKKQWPLLIVVPSSLRYPWIDEMEKWIPELCPDDISIIQNKTDTGNAIRSKILLPIVQNADRAILLTGTPALGRPEELFMQIEALFPRRFGTWSEYAKKYCNAHVRFFGKRAQWDCRGASNLDELHQLLSNIMIRRLKNEVLPQLPPKIRQRIPFDLPTAAAKELNTSFKEWEKLMRTPNSDVTESHFVQVMGLITRMYKQTAIAKAGAVKDYIKMMLENDKLKFLVFAHHLSMLQACTEAAIENKARYIRIDGSVPSVERIHLVHQFQKDPDTRVAILSIQAAGQGLTFTAATHIVFAELYWDPGHVKQAEDRAHRIGQCSCVNIHYLIAKGTLDPLMWAMLNRKAKVTGSTLNGKKEKLQAEEGDKEKWDFLSFAEAWTPNESLEEIRNEVLFTHFEKEKQHDIRSFFSPKPSTDKKRKVVCGDESLNFTLGDSKVTQGKDMEESSRHLNSREIIDVDAICYENGCEPEAKRPRAISAPTQSSSSKKKRKTLAGKTNSLFTEETDHELSGGSLSDSRKKSPAAKAWCCSLCSYTNNLLLPYCEICECPRGIDVKKNKNQINDLSTPNEGENASQDSRKINDTAVCNTDNMKEDLVLTVTEPSDEIGGEVANATENESEDCEQKHQEGHIDNSDSFPVYDGLKFCASRNTDRIHLYTKDGESLNCNFIPLDIKLDNWEDLPEIFQQKQNRSLILRFVREWNSLTAMKQKIIRKSGNTFCSPILAAEEISKQQARLSSTKRYVTKEDIAVASLSKAKSSGGSVCLVTKESAFYLKNEGASAGETDGQSTKLLLKDGKVSPVLNAGLVQDEVVEDPAIYKGYIQAVDNKGNPLCLRCQQPTVHLDQHCKSIAWETRFCSLKCQEDFLICSSQSYLRSKVFEVERGICQLCNLNAQELYLSIKDAPNSQRKNLLESSWMSQLPLGQLNEIITNPTEGQFWQVDHIKPVYSGGGQCSLENLQTLCTVCHKERTAKQAKERSQMKRQSLASKYGSDITKFFVKM
ncbi:DNA annealing helicase and endonuclease ZRANB3 isoform X2 [Emydura macquarii macquarii]|uniref:DNA annealing helicase and endonuclease ZRANB3 isoform X2 n=1 Tax=Emydura macquarii macquarii TaxID=1129001 RepID=UPI00352BADE4